MRVYYGWTTVAAAAVATETVAPYGRIVILKQLCAIRFYFDHQIRCERREKNKMRRKKTLTRLTLLFLSLISLIVAAVVVVVLIVQTSATWLRIVVAITCLRVCVCDERLTASWGLQLFGSHVYDSLSCVLWLLIIFVINLSGPTQNIHWMARFRQFVCHPLPHVLRIRGIEWRCSRYWFVFVFSFLLLLSFVIARRHIFASSGECNTREERRAQRSDGRGENA